MTTTTLPPGRAKEEPVSKPRRSDRAKAELRLGWMLAGPAFAVMLLVTAYPILQAIWDSLFDYRLTDPDAKSFTGLNNYVVVLTDWVWWRAILVTVLVTAVTVAVELVLGFALAMVMHRALYLRTALRTAILVPYGIITVVSSYAWAYAFSNTYGFVNPTFGLGDFDWFGGTWSALFTVCVAEIWKTTPFMSLLLLAGLAQVSEDMIEAAKVDGASWWQRLFRVILPNMKAAIMVAVLFRALDAYRIFDNIFVMTNGAEKTESISFLTYRQTIEQFQLGMGSALSVLLFLSVLLVAYLIVKVFKVDLAQARQEA